MKPVRMSELATERRLFGYSRLQIPIRRDGVAMNCDSPPLS
jgi:hypothetical protein